MNKGYNKLISLQLVSLQKETVMDITIFKKFDSECQTKLAKEINKILKKAKGQNQCAIGFITTDDFYGFYLSWEYTDTLKEYYNWKNGLQPKFLYKPLADIVDSCKDIDFCNPSNEKWEFAKLLLSVLEKNIRNIPNKIFQKNNFKREDILFFATMSDGDYIEEMLNTSIKMFNNAKTLKMYNCTGKL